MSKLNKKSQDLQFVYEEDENGADEQDVSSAKIDVEELGDLEFSAATVVKDNPLMSNSEEFAEASSQPSEDDGKAIEMSDEAKAQNTATVIRLSDEKKKKPKKDQVLRPKTEDVKKEEKKKKVVEATRDDIKVQKERTRDNIKIAKLDKAAADSFDEDEELDFGDSVCDLLDSDALEQIWSVKNDADVRVAVAEFKSEFLSEYMAEVKVLEFKIDQLLRPLAKVKNPAIQKQVMKIKKVIHEHAKGTTTLIKESKKTKSTELPSQKIKAKKAA